MIYINQLSALAHPHRLRIFRYLVGVTGEAVPAGKIGMELQITASSLSGYLATLLQAELLLQERNGRYVRYQINPDAVRKLMTYLISDCCAGNPELCDLALVQATQQLTRIEGGV